MNLEGMSERTTVKRFSFKLIKRNPTKNFIGKPYAGKPHVRIDEGAGKEFSPSRSTLPPVF
jgi:hypothetical protein